ncbi:MAG: DUF4491 family protein [Bacteroidales bacterium]|nr:DUF4491 family protein [Bacteroidales bacterium]
MNFTGLIIGIGSFLCIGLFHPLVIKAEYYWGVKSWWAFLFVGLAGIAGSLLCSNDIASILFGVFAFSSLWGIGEIFQQRKRVQRGWFPKNPKRKYD